MFHHVTATNCTTTAVVPFFLPLFSVNMCNHFPFIRSTFSAIMISTKKEKRRWRRQNRHKIICAQKEGKLVQRQRTHAKRMGEQKKNREWKSWSKSIAFWLHRFELAQIMQRCCFVVSLSTLKSRRWTWALNMDALNLYVSLFYYWANACRATSANAVWIISRAHFAQTVNHFKSKDRMQFT